MPDPKEVITEKYNRLIAEGLDKAYKKFELNNRLSLDIGKDRFVFVSDHHKGMQDKADNFHDCQEHYHAALEYYFNNGYTLIVMGDAEELWECRPSPVVKKYASTLKLEAGFNDVKRYYRVHGNHDDYWKEKGTVAKHLVPVFGGAFPFYNSLKIDVKENGSLLGELFIVHGNQGTLDSDRYSKYSKFFVRVFVRNFQRIFGIAGTSPKNDPRMRDINNAAMYNWASNRSGTALIAGHTHHPVFISRDLAGKIEAEADLLKEKLDEAKGSENAFLISDISEQYEGKKKELAEVKTKNTVTEPFRKTKPCYFNTGCCSFGDGDMTAIEISEGMIRLVRWPDDNKMPHKKILEAADLKSAVFSHLGPVPAAH